MAERVKTVYLLFFAIAFGALSFAWAQTTQTQSGGGSSYGDTSSPNYQMKIAAGEPGNGESRSSNYIYTHGTTWSGTATSTPLPSGGGGGGGSGGGAPGGGSSIPPLTVSGGGGSGSGAAGGTSEEAVGGVSPEVQEALAEEVEDTMPDAVYTDVPSERIAAYVEQMLGMNYWRPQIIRGVDSQNGVPGIAILLVRRVIPWPWWIVLLLLVAGGWFLVKIFRDPQEFRRGNVWLSGGLGVAAITLFLATRMLFAVDPTSFGIYETTTAATMQRPEAIALTRRLIQEKPVGVHRITVVDADNISQMKITIFVKSALFF